MSDKIASYLNQEEQEFLLNLIEQNYGMEAVTFLLNNKKIPKDKKFELCYRAFQEFIKGAI